MSFELVPPTLNPQMSYADIAAVVALFFTAFTFLFSMWQWTRKRKSEQITIARELVERLNIKYQRFQTRNEGMEHRYARHSATNPVYAPEKDLMKYIQYLDAIIWEFEYFFYLIDSKILEDDKNIGFYKSKLRSMFEDVTLLHLPLTKLLDLSESQIGIFDEVDSRIHELESKFNRVPT